MNKKQEFLNIISFDETEIQGVLIDDLNLSVDKIHELYEKYWYIDNWNNYLDRILKIIIDRND